MWKWNRGCVRGLHIFYFNYDEDQARTRSQLRHRNICSNVRKHWSGLLSFPVTDDAWLSRASQRKTVYHGTYARSHTDYIKCLDCFSTRALKALYMYSACTMLFNFHMPMDASETKLGFSNLPKDKLVDDLLYSQLNETQEGKTREEEKWIKCSCRHM